MTTRGETTTFWPMLQPRPMRAPDMTCEKCQIFVPAPISQPSSTYEDSCTKKSAIRSARRLRERRMEMCRHRRRGRRADAARQLDGRPAVVDAEPAAGERLLVDARVEIGKAFTELHFMS